MAETTFRFIYDSVAATTATSTAGGSTSGKSSTTEKPVDTGSPSRITNLMKQSSKSVQEGIKGGLKSLGIALSLGNLLKQSQVFTSSLNALFQIVGAFFDIILAPLMPYFAKWLRRGAPKLIEWAEKMAKWMENLFLEIGSAESFGSWIGEKVADGLIKGIKAALGIADPDTKPQDMNTTIEKLGIGGMNLFKGTMPMLAQLGQLNAMFQGTTDSWDKPFGEGGGMPKKPIGLPTFMGGYEQGGLLGTGMFSTDASMLDSINEIGELAGRGTKGMWNYMVDQYDNMGENSFKGNLGYGKSGMGGATIFDALGFGKGGMFGGMFNMFGGPPPMGNGSGGNNQTDVAGVKHDDDRRANLQKTWHIDNQMNAGSLGDN